MATRKINIICRRCGQPIPWGSTASTIGDDETTVYHPECAEEIIKEIHIDHLNHMLGMDSDTPGYRNFFSAERDHEVMRSMEQEGLVVWQDIQWTMSKGLWTATNKGKEMVGCPVEEKVDG